MIRPCPPLVAACPRARRGGVRSLLAPGAIAAPVKTAHVEAELVAAKTALVPGEPITVALAARDGEGLAHLLAQSRRFRACRRRSRGSCPPASRRDRSSGPRRAMLPVGPLVNYGYEGEVLHLVELRPQRTLDRRQHGRPRGARRLARVQGSVHSRGRGPDARAARGADRRRPTPRWGAGSPRRARRCRGRSPVGSASAEGSGTTIALKLVPPAGRGRSRRDSLLPVRAGPDRTVGAADASRATATPTC